MNSTKTNHRRGLIMPAINWTTAALVCCVFTANVFAQRQADTAQKTEPPKNTAQVSAETENKTSEETQVVSKRPFPFRGTIAKVDLEKKWIELKGTKNNRKMLITTETRMLWHGEKAQLSKAKVGESIGGSCLKLSDGTYRIVMVRFGPKDWENENVSAKDNSKDTNTPSTKAVSTSKSKG